MLRGAVGAGGRRSRMLVNMRKSNSFCDSARVVEAPPTFPSAVSSSRGMRNEERCTKRMRKVGAVGEKVDG